MPHPPAEPKGVRRVDAAPGLPNAAHKRMRNEVTSATAPSAARTAAAVLWTLCAIGGSLVEAIARLGARALETLTGGLAPLEWGALVVVVALFVYGEGVRALQRRFVPHVVARARAAAARPGWWALVLAPLFSMSLVMDERRAMVRAWTGIALIVLAVIAVRALPSPWRGIVDAGVASALSWGLIALVIASARVLRAPAVVDAAGARAT